MAKPITPLLTVDIIITTRGGVVLVKRKHVPFGWALPGGFVDVGEMVEAACARELKEETGLAVTVGRLVGVYSDPKRDPRGHTVGVAFACTCTDEHATGGDDALEARWLTIQEARPLAFDHEHILEDYLK